MVQFKKSFTNFHLNSLRLNNRIVLSPMTRMIASEDGLATEIMNGYYANFAKGKFGLLITEGTYIDESYSQAYLNQPGIVNEDQVQAWHKVTGAVHQHGSKIICQLLHSGALSQGNRYINETIAPSAIKPITNTDLASYGGTGEFPVPKEMSKEEMNVVVKSFANSALRAKQAGFDGVEIHGANGYLLDQFLTDYTNQRTDEYGGSIEKRLRFPIEVIQGIRNAVGSDFVVGIRLSQSKGNNYYHKWVNGEKDAEVIFSSIGKAGVDYIHLNEYDATLPAFNNDGPTLASLAKKYSGIPVIACGKLEDPKKGETLLLNEEADLIALGKGALANPDWPKRVLEGNELKAFIGDFSILV